MNTGLVLAFIHLLCVCNRPTNSKYISRLPLNRPALRSAVYGEVRHKRSPIEVKNVPVNNAFVQRTPGEVAQSIGIASLGTGSISPLNPATPAVQSQPPASTGILDKKTFAVNTLRGKLGGEDAPEPLDVKSLGAGKEKEPEASPLALGAIFGGKNENTGLISANTLGTMLGGAGAAPLGVAPLGVAPLGIAPLDVAPLGVAPLGVAPLGVAPLGVAQLGVNSLGSITAPVAQTAAVQPAAVAAAAQPAVAAVAQPVAAIQAAGDPVVQALPVTL